MNRRFARYPGLAQVLGGSEQLTGREIVDFLRSTTPGGEDIGTPRAERVIMEWPTPWHKIRVKISDLNWRPGSVEGTDSQKLIRKYLKQPGTPPPIIIQPQEYPPPAYEIIDGFHRVAVAVKRGETEIEAYAPLEKAEGSTGGVDQTKYPALATTLAPEVDYRGEHQAPDKSSGAPMHDLQGTYPEDIYSSNGARYYGDNGGDQRDQFSLSIMRACRGKPNTSVRIYRAVPQAPTREDKIQTLQTHKRYILKHGKVPPGVSTNLNRSEYYTKISEELTALEAQHESAAAPKLSIHPGDWVTISRDYAKEHGESALNGAYKILTKTVKARDLYTDGNSFHEWGYDPS